jgi:hypothetical protein
MNAAVIMVFVILDHSPVKTDFSNLVAGAACVCFGCNFMNTICSRCRICVCVWRTYKNILNEAGGCLGRFQTSSTSA